MSGSRGGLFQAEETASTKAWGKNKPDQLEEHQGGL